MKKTSVLLASLMVAACASSPKTNISQVTPSSDSKASPVSAVAPATASTTPSAARVELNQLAADIEKLQKQSDYFDYNKYEIKPEYIGVLKTEAAFMKAHANDFVTLQGNADERGSEEYNLTLGEKRAEAVQKTLIKFGVPANQFKLVTLGKQKPRLTCHEEKCWKENRRVDFLHKLS
jgi:peptidoglycan-associated lipoprotein